MESLVIINRNNQLLAESREVAELVGKEHAHLMRDIRGYEKILKDNPNLDSRHFFIESTYVNSQNKIQPCYLITKKGCDMVANKMTGEKGVIFTATYVSRFEEREQQLRNPYQNLSTEMKALLMHDEKIQEIGNKVEKVDRKFDDLPLFPSDSKVLKKLANQTVVPLLGGKKSNAYKRLSRKVFSDLYKQIHREFGVVGCEEIKRKDLEFAKEIIYSYKLPRALEEEIKLLNTQVAFA
ncbi:ORF6C domain-containing protein [Paraclostridium ghonii]|uniref:Rha family transcriptional regulator n=1 Tax=Paraclostridium ghonii TaxID=29358 RepID=UPI00202CE7FD|nr:Rha family transcriptional regulator [Paeniclostridium ghonii]MCM0167045.1 ORF6C domain-containing protein [Paeniclostridium ghonii]